MARSERESALRRPLTVMLGVDSNIRVLRVLSQHGGLLAASDIVRKSRLSRESVRGGLLALEPFGIVLSSGAGRSKVYSFNGAHSFGQTLSALFEAEAERFAAILQAVRESAEGERFSSLFIYGSAARGDDRPDSDLDIAIIAHPDDLARTVDSVRERLRDAAGKLLFLPNVVGLDFGDVSRLEKDDDPWWRNVRQEAVVLSGKRPEDVLTDHRAKHG